jgi:hypothetical protein
MYSRLFRTGDALRAVAATLPLPPTATSASTSPTSLIKVSCVWSSNELKTIHGVCESDLLQRMPRVRATQAEPNTCFSPVLFFVYFPRPRMLMTSEQARRLGECADKAGNNIILVAIRPTGSPGIAVSPLEIDGSKWRHVAEITVDQKTKLLHDNNFNNKTIDYLMNALQSYA